jgi:hypothetical protein
MKITTSKIVTCLLSSSLLIGCGDDTGGATTGGTTFTESDTQAETGSSGGTTGNEDESGTADSTSAGDGDSSGTSGDGDSSGTSGDGDSSATAGDGDSSATAGDGDSSATAGDGDSSATAGDGDSSATAGDGDSSATAGDGDSSATAGDGDGGTTTDSGGDGDSGDTGNWWDGEVDVPCPPSGSTDATLTGTVHAPNGTVPVSGALVYVTDTMPTPPQDGVYCEECVEFNCADTEGTLSNEDGSFTLNAFSGNGRYLVIQKGQFMRVTQLDVAAGTTAMPQADTDLPGAWNPGGGEWIPRIAVAYGSYDRIEDALGKLGLGDTMIAAQEESLVLGTQNFDFWDNGSSPGAGVTNGAFGTLLDSPQMMAQYHIIFIPCSSDATTLTAQRIQNIRDWVEAGGRWYASDWSGEMIRDVFPEYQNFYEDSGGSLDGGSYDSGSTTPDQGLLDWLGALPDALKDINPLNDETHPTLFGLPNIPTVDNWSGVQPNLPTILVDNGQGGQVNTGHRVWLEGDGSNSDIPSGTVHPLAITAQFGCGKLQFTSFQAAEFFDYVGLSPQELVLMYTILEIGVCQADIPLPE